MRMRMLSLIATVGFGAASPLPGQRGRQALDPVAMQCGAVTEPRIQAKPASPGAVRGRFGDTLRAGRRTERPVRTLETKGIVGQFSPGTILHRNDKLKLSAAQTTQLVALQKQARPDCARHVQLAMTAQQTANQLLEATAPDFAAYAAKLKEASAHTVEAQLVNAKAAVAARKVLSTGQRQTIEGRLQARRQ